MRLGPAVTKPRENGRMFECRSKVTGYVICERAASCRDPQCCLAGVLLTSGVNFTYTRPKWSV